MGVGGTTAPSVFHRRLGQIMLDRCGLREGGARERDRGHPQLREEFPSDLRVPGTGEELNQSLELAGRLADYFELAELMCADAIERDESAAATRARSTRLVKGRRSATTSSTRRCRCGSTAARTSVPTCNEHLSFDEAEPTARSYK